MLFDDTFRTVKQVSEGIFRDKGSKFQAFLYPIKQEADIRQILNELKSSHPKANHLCWAYRISPDRSVFRVNDDGEPSGTAGRPILNVLLSKDITNVLLVVVRYFGGTLLGVPGLINAYKSAASDAVGNAEVIEQTINAAYILNFPHEAMNEVMRLVKEEQIKINDSKYEEQYSLHIEFRQSSLNRISMRLDKIAGLNYKYTPV